MFLQQVRREQGATDAGHSHWRRIDERISAYGCTLYRIDKLDLRIPPGRTDCLSQRN
jgi:hypothetical protein